MTAHTTNTATTHFNPLGYIQGFFAAIGRGLVAMGENTSRARELERLSALSDQELAEMGLRRDRIVQWVYRDVISL